MILRWLFRLLGALTLLIGAVMAIQYTTQDRDLITVYDISYGSDPQQRMDLCSLAKNPVLERPVIVFVHGGGWISGHKGDFRDFTKGFAREGYLTATIEYRLATPEGNHYPAALDDVQLAVRWLRAHAQEYHLDPQRMGAIGASAGGHLVAMLGLTDTLAGPEPLSQYSSRVTCVVDLFGPADLTSDFSKNIAGDQPVSDILVTFLGQKKSDAPNLYHEASPLFHIDSHAVPFLIIHGRDDPTVPVDQSVRLSEALKANGTEVRLMVLDGEGHGISSRHFPECAEAMKSFLKKHLNPPVVAP